MFCFSLSLAHAYISTADQKHQPRQSGYFQLWKVWWIHAEPISSARCIQPNLTLSSVGHYQPFVGTRKTKDLPSFALPSHSALGVVVNCKIRHLVCPSTPLAGRVGPLKTTPTQLCWGIHLVCCNIHGSGDSKATHGLQTAPLSKDLYLSPSSMTTIIFSYQG